MQEEEKLHAAVASVDVLPPHISTYILQAEWATWTPNIVFLRTHWWQKGQKHIKYSTETWHQLKEQWKLMISKYFNTETNTELHCPDVTLILIYWWNWSPIVTRTSCGGTSSRPSPPPPEGCRSRLRIFVVCAAEALFSGAGHFHSGTFRSSLYSTQPHWNYVLRETANNCAECEVYIRIYDAFMDTHAQVSSCR